MTTKLSKCVKRLSDNYVRDGGKPKRIVVTLYPSGVIGLRPERTRREEFINIDDVWRYAVRRRVQAKQLEKARAKRKVKRKW